MSCPKGEVRRVAYNKKNGTHVPSTCITNRGAPGKGPKKIELKNEGMLSNAGYHETKNMSEQQRHNALNRAIREHGHLKVIRGLGGRLALVKRTDPKQYKIFKEDQNWVSKKYAKHKEENKK